MNVFGWHFGYQYIPVSLLVKVLILTLCTLGDYEFFRKAQNAKPSTITKELGLLRRMFNLAIKKWKWTKENPVSLIELPKVDNARVRYLDSAEYQALFKTLEQNSIPTWLKPIVIIALNTGLRESNLLKLEWSSVNLFSRLIIIEGEQMKNRDSIGLPLTQEAFETFRALQRMKADTADLVFHDNGQEIYPVKLQRAFKRACKIAGIEDFRFHDLRHTFASYLRQRGIDLHTISKLLGHRDIRMTQRYSHLCVDTLRSAISVLDLKEGAQKGAQSKNFEICNEVSP